MEDDEVFEGTLEEFNARLAGAMNPTDAAAVAAVFGTMLACGITKFDSQNVPDLATRDVILRVKNGPDGKSWSAEIVSCEPRGTIQ